ncbi:hypothetical protein PROFUN_14431 [Planoprotostelium fungivorum]|uniref:Late embryogenesis abundant protein LEA-2 subgroup domain-containing protein n=1 Tax=Planoprotostelium fungivorum TaxID=1890364 RepID=A0A2P6N0B1_9EUKA|nr:hypothetical protein PROFUN_14431 [Planoprotostelium fungivorum]
MDYSGEQPLLGQHKSSDSGRRKCFNSCLTVCACIVFIAMLIPLLIYYIYPRAPTASISRTYTDIVLYRYPRSVYFNITHVVTVYNPNYVAVTADDIAIDVYYQDPSLYRYSRSYIGSAKMDSIKLAGHQNTTFNMKIIVTSYDSNVYSDIQSDSTYGSGMVPVFTVGNMTVTHLKFTFSLTIQDNGRFQIKED